MAGEAPPPGLAEFLTPTAQAAAPEPGAEAGSPPPPGLEQFVHSEAQAEKYGTGVEQLKTVGEGIGKGLAGPLFTGFELAGGAKPEDIRGREEVNPMEHGIAEAGTFLGSALVGTGEAALLGEAGKAVTLGEEAAKASRLAKFGSEAAKAAFEGALYQSGEELHKRFVQDPNQTAESALTNIGITGVLSGVFGGTLGATLGTHNAATEAEPFISQLEHPKLAAGDLHTAVNVSDEMHPNLKDKVLDAIKLNKEKPDAGTYRKAANDLGLPIPSGSTLASPYVERSIYALSQNPYTVAGDAVNTALNDAYGKATNVLTHAVEGNGAASAEQFGNDVRSHLVSSIKEAYAPQKAAFKALEAVHSSVPVQEDVVAALSKALRDIKEVKLGAGSDEGMLVKQVLRSAERAQTADDITTIHNMAALKDLSSPTQKDPLSYIKTVIKDKLTEMQETAIENYSKGFARNDEAGAYMKSLVDGFRAQKQIYKPYIKNLSTLSEWLGKGSIRGTENALHFIENLSGTEFAGKVLRSSKDPEFVRFLQKNFPDVHKMVVEHGRAAQVANSTFKGEFSPNKFISNYNKLEPEVQKALYTAEEQKKISQLETYYKNAFPKNFNPSGTASHGAFLDAHASPHSIITANVRDYAIKKVIDKASASAETKQALKLAEHTVQGENLIKNTLKSVFDASKEIPKSAIPAIANRAKLDKLVESYVSDPAKMVAMNDNNNSVPEYSQAFAASGARVVQYLASLKPKTDPKFPLDSKRPANNIEKSAYHRALDIAEQPLVVLNSLKAGRITSKDIIALRTMYPNLYSTLAQKMSESVADSVHKGKPIPYPVRMGLSMFLGQPLDSSLTPQAIMSAQMNAINASAKASQAQQPQSRAPSSSSVKGLQKLPGMAQTPGQQREMSRSTGKH